MAILASTRFSNLFLLTLIATATLLMLMPESKTDSEFIGINGSYNFYEAVHLCRSETGGTGRLVVPENNRQLEYLSDVAAEYRARTYHVNAQKFLYGELPSWETDSVLPLPAENPQMACYAVSGNILIGEVD